MRTLLPAGEPKGLAQPVCCIEQVKAVGVTSVTDPSGLIGIDLFAGAGGMSLGARQAGIKVELAMESDPHAAETYASNHRTTQLFAEDIRTLKSSDLAPWKAVSDRLIVFGGPPCRGFSWSNLRTRNMANETNWLFREFVRVVKILKPAWVVFENVQGIVNTVNGFFLDQVRQSLEEYYDLQQALLNATHYGVPQKRTRFFLVGSRDGTPFRFPRKQQVVPLTVDDAIRDLPPLSNGNDMSWLPYGQAHPSKYGRAMRGCRDGCRNNIVTRNAQFVIRRYRCVPQGGNWEDIPVNLMSNYHDRTRCHTGIYHRLRADMPAVVIGNYRKNMLIHPFEDRGLSVREAARLQSFPDWFVLSGSIGFQQQQVGNAVPPLLAQAVFKQISRSHERQVA